LSLWRRAFPSGTIRHLEGACAAIEIGEVITYAGRRYIVRGFSEWASFPRSVYLHNAQTGESLRVPLDALDQQRNKLFEEDTPKAGAT
jgi:hypothetical protein